VIESAFQPKKAVADPDVHTLMIGRKTAEADVTEVTVALTSIVQSTVIAPHDP
jgi:hypothetical protein